MSVGLLDLVQLIAAYHAGLMGLIVLMRPRLRGLGLLCMGFAAHMAVNFAADTGNLPQVLDITSAFGLLYGPFFYLFVRDLAFEAKETRWLDMVHLLPAIAIAAIRPPDPFPQMLGLPSLIIYIGLALLILRDHRRVSGQIRSDDASVSLRWVEYALATFTALAAADIVREVLSQGQILRADDLFLALVILAVLALLSAMTVRAFQHLTQHGAVPQRDAIAVQPGDDTAQDNPETLARFTAIDTRVRDQELWREPRLGLSDLSKQCAFSARDVSQAINAASGQSFSRYINALRLEALDQLMSAPQNAHRTVIELAYEVGFNSKSAFNRIYREMTGTTPTQAFATLKSGKSVPKQDSGRPVS
jgi:AraC-like DNA-binding protein